MADPPTSVVLDSFALLAYFQDEPAASRIDSLLAEAATDRVELFLCTINLTEVLYRTERRRGIEVAQDVLATIQELPVELVTPDLGLSVDAAHLKAIHPVSLADCYIAALARRIGATVLTGDRDFARFGDYVQVEWL